jgi:hypothetical protein
MVRTLYTCIHPSIHLKKHPQLQDKS